MENPTKDEVLQELEHIIVDEYGFDFTDWPHALCNILKYVPGEPQQLFVMTNCNRTFVITPTDLPRKEPGIVGKVTPIGGQV